MILFSTLMRILACLSIFWTVIIFFSYYWQGGSTRVVEKDNMQTKIDIKQERVEYWIKNARKAIKHVKSYEGEVSLYERTISLFDDDKELAELVTGLAKYLPKIIGEKEISFALDKKRGHLPDDFAKIFLKKDKTIPMIDVRKNTENLPRGGLKENHVARNVNTFTVKDLSKKKGLDLLICIWSYRYTTVKTDVTGDKAQKEMERVMGETRSLGVRVERIAFRSRPVAGLTGIARVDEYHNVIYDKAAPYSLFSLQYDHTFAWARGGRKCDGNVIAMHYYANSLKSSHWAFAKSPDTFYTGASLRMFREMVFKAREMYTEGYIKVAKEKRSGQQLDRELTLWVLNYDWYPTLNKALQQMATSEGKTADFLSSKMGETFKEKMQREIRAATAAAKPKTVRLQALYKIRRLLPKENFWTDVEAFNKLLVKRMFKIYAEKHRKIKQ